MPITNTSSTFRRLPATFLSGQVAVGNIPAPEQHDKLPSNFETQLTHSTFGQSRPFSRRHLKSARLYGHRPFLLLAQNAAYKEDPALECAARCMLSTVRCPYANRPGHVIMKALRRNTIWPLVQIVARPSMRKSHVSIVQFLRVLQRHSRLYL